MGEREGEGEKEGEGRERRGEEQRGERNEPVCLYMEAKDRFLISFSVAFLLIFEAGSLTVSDLDISTR